MCCFLSAVNLLLTSRPISPSSHTSLPNTDAWGYMAVYLGRSGKSAEVNKSTSLFRPINSEYPVNVDRAQVRLEFDCTGVDEADL